MIIEARKSRITLSGAMERSHWKTIRAAAQLLLEHSPVGIVVDCRQVGKMTPEGVTTFEQGISEVTAQGHKIIFAGLPPDLRQTVGKIPGLRSEMILIDTVEEAERILGIETRYTERPVGTGELNVVVMGENLIENPAITLACLLAKRRLTRLHITHMVEVPHFLPLSASTSEVEEVGRALDSARSFAQTLGFPPTVEIAHVRTLEAGLDGVMSDLCPNAVFLAVPRGETQILSRLTQIGMDLHILLGEGALTHHKADKRPLSILLPVHENLDTERTVTLVSRLSALKEKEVILCALVEVPRALALAVPASEAVIASAALEKISKRLRNNRVKHQIMIQPVRDFALGLKNLAKTLSPDLTILDPITAAEGEKIAAAVLPGIGCDLLWLTRGGALGAHTLLHY
jgi:anti-anti-sigma regulatory factor